MGGPGPVTGKGSVVEGPVLGEVPARGTAGTYPQGCLFVPSYASIAVYAIVSQYLTKVDFVRPHTVTSWSGEVGGICDEVVGRIGALGAVLAS